MVGSACQELAGFIPSNPNQPAIESACLRIQAVSQRRLPKLADIYAVEIWTVCGGVTEDYTPLNVALELLYGLLAHCVENGIAGAQESRFGLHQYQQ